MQRLGLYLFRSVLIVNQFFLKYLADKVFIFPLVILFSPVMLLICIGIWLEGLWDKEARGPLFYNELRMSQGKPFVLYKFRTLKLKVIRAMTDRDSATFLQFERKNSTRMGRLIIKWYFDELPQLFCILIGTMTLVGPRPRINRVYEEDLKNGNTALKHLRAGLTGVHQLRKGTKGFSVGLSDEYYEKVQTLSAVGLLAYDLSLLFKSFLKMVKAEGL